MQIEKDLLLGYQLQGLIGRVSHRSGREADEVERVGYSSGVT